MDAPLWTGAGKSEVLGFDRTTTALTYVASGDFAAYGSWVEIGVTTGKWDAFEVLLLGDTGEAPFRVRVGLGAAGSEVTVVDGLRVQNRVTPTAVYMLPVGIPAGTRVAVATSNDGSGSAAGVYVGLRGYPGHPYGLAPYSRAIDVNPSVNAGASIVSSGVANTLSSWQEVVASTSEDMRLIIPFVAPETTNQSQYSFVDFAVGGSGSEEAFLEGIYTVKETFNPHTGPPIGWPLPISIPAGSRISARVQSSATDADDVSVSILGIS